MSMVKAYRKFHKKSVNFFAKKVTGEVIFKPNAKRLANSVENGAIATTGGLIVVGVAKGTMAVGKTAFNLVKGGFEAAGEGLQNIIPFGKKGDKKKVKEEVDAKAEEA